MKEMRIVRFVCWCLFPAPSVYECVFFWALFGCFSLYSTFEKPLIALFKICIFRLFEFSVLFSSVSAVLLLLSLLIFQFIHAFITIEIARMTYKPTF